MRPAREVPTVADRSERASGWFRLGLAGLLVAAALGGGPTEDAASAQTQTPPASTPPPEVSAPAPTEPAPTTPADPPAPEWVQELIPETAPPPPPVLEPGEPEPTTNREVIPSPPPEPRVPRKKKVVDPFRDLPKDAAPMEIEAALSQTPDLYVLVDPAESVIEVRSRGISLDSMPITRSELLYSSGAFLTGAPPHFPSPSLWRVQKTPDDAVRELIAPAELKRWVPEDERPDEPTTPSKARQETQPPTSYRIQLNDGWDLAILGELPSRGLVTRLLEAAKTGWSRLIGRTVAHPPTVALVLSADDSRRLHHVFREGLPVLLSPRHSD